jgi:hypothetical protein
VIDLFCAFQPKRAMVASLPLTLGTPWMPRAARRSTLDVRLLVRQDLAVGDRVDEP